MISLFEQTKNVWTPRKRIGEDKTLTQIERDILDGVDVQEQKVEYAIRVSVRAHNMMVIVAMILVATEGVSVVRVIQKWLGGSPVATVAVEGKK